MNTSARGAAYMASWAHRILQAPRVLFEQDLYEMVLRVYLPILFPLTVLISLASLGLDAYLGLPAVIPEPYNFHVAALSILSGACLWILTYATLVYGGDGSPAPVVRRTQRLVTWGIYAYCRNPSIHGKLLGFLAVGFALNSASFVYILAPLLLCGSLIEKVWRQEPQLIEIFGEEYLAYRERVPLFLPFPRLYRLLRRRSQGDAA